MTTPTQADNHLNLALKNIDRIHSGWSHLERITRNDDVSLEVQEQIRRAQNAMLDAADKLADLSRLVGNRGGMF